MYIRIVFSIELRLRVSRSLRSLANHMNKSAIFALTTVQIALGFASCDFSVAVQFFFPESHSHPCDYLYNARIPFIGMGRVYIVSAEIIPPFLTLVTNGNVH